MAQRGTSVSLQDAETIVTNDVLFPEDAFTAAQKLCAWSVAIDIFHGVNHPVAVAIRGFVVNISSAIQAMALRNKDNPAYMMDLVARVMFDAQQEYFLYGMSVGRGQGGAVPDFSCLTNLVTTHRTDSLSGIPSPWYYKFSVLNGERERGNGCHTATENSPAGSARSQSGSAVVVNSHVDANLKNHFVNSGHATISK